jgi:hypothetical protein
VTLAIQNRDDELRALTMLAFNISVTIPPGTAARENFLADKSGNFSFFSPKTPPNAVSEGRDGPRLTGTFDVTPANATRDDAMMLDAKYHQALRSIHTKEPYTVVLRSNLIDSSSLSVPWYENACPLGVAISLTAPCVKQSAACLAGPHLRLTRVCKGAEFLDTLGVRLKAATWDRRENG